MNKKIGEFRDIIIRYILLIALSFNGLFIFYLIFTPLTVYPLFFIFNYFFGAVLDGTTIYAGDIPIEIIKACVAGSAYYLLLIFNLSTPDIKINQRLRMIFFSFLIFLAVNILRIVILSIMYISGSSLFDITHLLTWYAGSVILVIAIWFWQVKIYRLKDIPFYSDLRFLYKHSVLNRK